MKPVTSASENLLAIGVAQGVTGMNLEDRLAILFEELRGPLYRYLLLLLWDAADAEELTQEAFLRLHRACLDGKKIGNVKAWLFRVAHNLAVDHLRSSRPTDSLTDERIHSRAETASPSADPETLALNRERLGALSQAIHTLSPRQRECLHLRAEGFGYREISAILEVGLPTVVENVRRAVLRLAKEFHVSR